MNNSLVSIIVPVYNVENYIRECVDSLLIQTYKTIEIILVDDGSTDKSGLVCDEYLKIDRRVKVIHQSNHGVSYARNAGIDASKGAYITFVDSDDYVDKKYIEKLIYPFLNSNCDISMCGVEFVGDLQDKYNMLIPKNGEFNRNEILLEMVSSEVSMCYVISCAKLYKRKLFNNIKFPTGKRHEDDYTTYRLIALSDFISVVGEPLYIYRQRNGSYTHSDMTDIQFLNGVLAYIERYNFLKVNKNSQVTINRAVDIMMNCYALRMSTVVPKTMKEVEIKNDIKTKVCDLIKNNRSDFGILNRIKYKFNRLSYYAIIFDDKLDILFEKAKKGVYLVKFIVLSPFYNNVVIDISSNRLNKYEQNGELLPERYYLLYGYKTVNQNKIYMKLIGKKRKTILYTNKTSIDDLDRSESYIYDKYYQADNSNLFVVFNNAI